MTKESDAAAVSIGLLSKMLPITTKAFSCSARSWNAIREAAKLIQGGGGGQPHFATAGGKNPDGLSAAVDQLVELLSK